MKKNILIRIGSLRNGGAEKTLVTLLKNLPKDKYNIDLLLNLRFGTFLPDVPDWVNVLHLNRGEMITTNRPQDIPIKAFRKIYQGILKMFPKPLYSFILKNKKYDIEIAANHVLSAEILNSPQKKSKKITWIHSDLENSDLSQSNINALPHFDKILCISQKIIHSVKKLGVSDQKIEHFYNPIDEQDIAQKSEEKIDINTHHLPIFLSVGTLYNAKGFDRLIKAHHKLISEGFQHQVWIIGAGQDEMELKNLAKTLEVENSVKFLGFQKNPYPYFKLADYYVLSSRYEGFPTVLFEAITLKKKIIATQVSGADEMLENGQLGLIVENSEDGIYQGMKETFINPDKFNDFEQNIHHYQPPFNLKSSTQHFMKIIDNI